MRTRLKNRIIAVMTVFSIVMTLLGGVPVRAEEKAKSLPEELEDAFKDMRFNDQNLKLSLNDGDAGDSRIKSVAEISMRDDKEKNLTVYIRKEAELTEPKTVEEKKADETEHYRVYTVAAKKTVSLEIVREDDANKALPLVVVSDGETYNFVSEKDEPEKRTEKEEKEQSETLIADEKKNDREMRSAETPLKMFQQVKAGSCSSGETSHIVKIHKVDKETKEPMAGVEFTATAQCQESVTGTTNEDGYLELKLSTGTWRIHETTPEGYRDHNDYLVLVNPEAVEIFEINEAAEAPKKRKRRSLDTEKHDPETPIEKITQYEFYCQGYKKTFPNDWQKRFWVTSGDSIQMNVAFDLKDTARAGDTFQIRFDEKLKPGNLTVPYTAPAIFLKDISMPAAVPTFDVEKNVITYTLTEVVNNRRNVKMHVNFEAIGAKAENRNLRANEWNDFTNSVTGVSGGTFTKTNSIFVDYGSTDKQISAQSGDDYDDKETKGSWSIGAFSQVDRGQNPVYVDAVFYVNMKPGKEINWRRYENRVVLFDAQDTLGELQDIEVYQIPDWEKARKMQRSFPLPENVQGLSKYRYNGKINYKDQSKYKIPRSILELPAYGRSTDGYIIRFRYKAKEVNDRAVNLDSTLYVDWKANRGRHQWFIKHVGQYAGGEAGEIVADLVVQNEKKPPDIALIKTDEKGKPLEGAVFELRLKDEKSVVDIREAVSGKDGQIVFKEVPDGLYSLWETKTSDESFILPEEAMMQIVVRKGKVYRINEDFAGNKTEEPLDDTNRTVVNESKGRVKLVINKIDEKAETPLPNAEFSLWDEKGNVVATVVTDQNGRAEVKDLLYGTYSLKETRAPEGYTCCDVAETIVVKKDNSFQVPNYTGNDVSGEIRLVESKLTKDILHGEDRAKKTIYPNKGERMKVFNNFSIEEGGRKIRPGDYFFLMLSEDINPYGIVPLDEVQLDIESPYGTLAKGEYVEQGRQRYILYRFTDCVQNFDVRKFSTQVTYYVDPMRVKGNQDVEVSQSIYGGSKKTFSVYADFSGIETVQKIRDSGAMDLCSHITHVDTKDKKMTYYLYVNRDHRPVNREGTDRSLRITGKNLDLEKATVTIFQPIEEQEKKEKMPVSFGFDDGSLGAYYKVPARNNEKAVKLENTGNAKALNIHFKELSYKNWDNISAARLLGQGRGYVVKVECPIEGESTSAKIATEYHDGFAWLERHDEVYMTENASNLEGEIVVTRTNRKNEVEFEKTDMAGKPLTGALFDLYKGETRVKEAIEVNANSRIVLRGLASGNYTLKETRAPEGYKLPRGAVATFKVTQKGEITDVSALCGDDTLCAESHTIVNKKGYYPSTGGMGFALYIFTGLILMSMSLVFIRKKH